MLSLIVAIIISLATTGTTPPPSQTSEAPAPTTTNEKPSKEKTKASSDPSMSTYGGTGTWSEG